MEAFPGAEASPPRDRGAAAALRFQDFLNTTGRVTGRSSLSEAARLLIS